MEEGTGRENRGDCVYTGRTSSLQVPVERVSSHLMQRGISTVTDRSCLSLTSFTISTAYFPACLNKASVAGKKPLLTGGNLVQDKAHLLGTFPADGWRVKGATFLSSEIFWGTFRGALQKSDFSLLHPCSNADETAWHTKDLPAANVTTMFTIVRVEHRLQIICIHLFPCRSGGGGGVRFQQPFQTILLI